MVIIAGGLATRLGKLSAQTPKSMLRFSGKPFLQYQIELLRSKGIKKFVLCVGHFSEQIKQYFGSGKDFGVQISYSDEGEKLLGTGGALKKAEDLLEDDFFIMWGDSYLLLDYKDIFKVYIKSEIQALMVVYKNFNERDKSNVVVKNNKVILYDKWSISKDKVYIDNGVSILNKKLLQCIPKDEVFALELIFKKLAQENNIAAYKAEQCFYEIGSVGGIKDFKDFVGSCYP